MNLYLVERTDSVGWDEYSAMIVAAPTEEAACAILPCESGWTGELLLDGEEVTLEATLLGTTHYPEGEVLYTDYLYG
ncbi:hypothetical protein GAP86_18370 [Salmonella enterica]|nr:hypothetical protein [Salmonella enterica]